eukprot:2305818-Karenia_brevis.AAC.1
MAPPKGDDRREKIRIARSRDEEEIKLTTHCSETLRMEWRPQKQPKGWRRSKKNQADERRREN